MSKQFWRTLALALGTLLTTLILLVGQVYTAQAIVEPQPQLVAQAGGFTVDRLSDVAPTDYYYTSLQNLVEKYACVTGYPDLTFQASRSIVRAEVIGQLSSCLDRFGELIAASTADLATSEDLLTQQRLITEFSQEVTLLRRL